MPEALLAIDAGTTSVRILIVRLDGQILASVRETLPIAYPAPGRVEQDAEHIWSTVHALLHAALRQTRLTARDVAALGITTQRASCLVWDRVTGRALSPLVSWQDLRGADRSAELRAAGFFVMPQSAAAKLESVLNAVPDGRRRAETGELAWGNIDSYIAFKLSGGAIHATDRSQACTTAYLDFQTGDWSAPLLNLQQLPPHFFPKLIDTSGTLGECATSVLAAPIPIAAIVGDQQSATIAEDCRTPGLAKATYGTSATVNVHTGSIICTIPGTYPLILSHTQKVTEYCIEGMVITAGAALDWLTAIGLTDTPPQVDALGTNVNDSGGVYILPAWQGLGSPHGDHSRRGLITGLSRSTRREHIVRAMLEGIAFRVRDVLDAIYTKPDIPHPHTLRTDGGASVSDLLMQLQADTLGCTVERMTPTEASAFGAALLAGAGAGALTHADLPKLRHINRVFEPRLSHDERDARYAAWRNACGLPHTT